MWVNTGYINFTRYSLKSGRRGTKYLSGLTCVHAKSEKYLILLCGYLLKWYNKGAESELNLWTTCRKIFQLSILHFRCCCERNWCMGWATVSKTFGNTVLKKLSNNVDAEAGSTLTALFQNAPKSQIMSLAWPLQRTNNYMYFKLGLIKTAEKYHLLFKRFNTTLMK